MVLVHGHYEPGSGGGIWTTINRVEGVTEDQPIMSYTGNALRDNATTPNIVETFSNFLVNEAAVSCEKVVVSNCGKYIYVKLNGGYYFPNSNNPIQFTLKYGADKDSATTLSKDTDYISKYSYSTDGNDVDIYFSRTSTPVLTEGNKYFIEVNSNGILDYAGDAVDSVNCEGTPSATAESTVAPTVKYNSAEKSLLLDFSDDSGLEGRSKACLLTVSEGGKEYRLRGKMRISKRDPNIGDILLTNENFSFDADTFNWSGATISFSRDVHPNADVGDSIIFESGKPYEGFGATTITVI